MWWSSRREGQRGRDSGLLTARARWQSAARGVHHSVYLRTHQSFAFYQGCHEWGASMWPLGGPPCRLGAGRGRSALGGGGVLAPTGTLPFPPLCWQRARLGDRRPMCYVRRGTRMCYVWRRGIWGQPAGLLTLPPLPCWRGSWSLVTDGVAGGPSGGARVAAPFGMRAWGRAW